MIVKKGIENADCKIKSEDELMNKSDFNLIEEQWIPVAQIGLVSLRDIFSNPDLPALGGSVLEVFPTCVGVFRESIYSPSL